MTNKANKTKSLPNRTQSATSGMTGTAMVGKADGKRSASRVRPASRSPDELAQSVASGIRAARRRKSMTLSDLAARTKLDKGFLSRLERGEKMPSIEALLRIAEALDVQVSQLFGETNDEDAIKVVRARGQSDATGALDELSHVLIPASSKRRLNAFVLEPTKENDLHHHAEHPGDELLYVLAGSIEISFTDRLVTLDVGDCIYFDGHLRHYVRSKGRKRARVLAIVA
jgi:transcriptional regulator with XRE-family HTH domain